MTLGFFVWVEINEGELHEKREFVKLKDAERWAFHERRTLKNFFVITITAGDDYERQLTIMVGPKYREAYGS